MTSAVRRRDEPARIRIGFYSHASRIGGAETYVRDVVHGLDPETFEIHVFVPPWREFIDFLGIRERRDLQLHVVRIVEPQPRFRLRDPANRRTVRRRASAPSSSSSSPIRNLALALRLPPSGLRLGHDALRYASLPRQPSSA